VYGSPFGINLGGRRTRSASWPQAGDILVMFVQKADASFLFTRFDCTLDLPARFVDVL
jgi:hypothetical protein